MSDEERLYWVAVSQSPGIGSVRFLHLVQTLLKHNVSFKKLWTMSPQQMETLIPWESIREAFLAHRQTFSLEKTLEKIHKNNVQVVTFHDEEYPSLLQHIPDKPPILFIRGSLSRINQSPYAIVGTRKITSYGNFVTKKIVTELVANECSIISGFMYGVDAVAHQTAVMAKGYTVGVLGFGFDHMYPESHRSLANEIIESGGALITEYFFDKTPHPGNFPARNRIVAGLSLGVVVTEAATKSGSKITAQLALEYGRDVFAVPGAITSQYSDGTKDLINDGAKLVTSASDILQQSNPTKTPNFLTEILQQCTDETERKIVSLLVAQQFDVDELSAELAIEVSLLSSKLSLLELQGIVIQEQGKYTVRF